MQKTIIPAPPVYGAAKYIAGVDTSNNRKPCVIMIDSEGRRTIVDTAATRQSALSKAARWQVKENKAVIKSIINDEHTVWLCNRSDMERQLTGKEILSKFKRWLKTKEPAWGERYGLHEATTAFIGEKDGLNAVAEAETYDKLKCIFKEPFYEYVYGKK